MHCVDWNGANSRAVGEFPHPATGMFYLRTGQLDRKDYRAGCNTYISPDNSYFVTIMAGSHDLVTLYKPDGSSRDKVEATAATQVNGLRLSWRRARMPARKLQAARKLREARQLTV